jgi:hypothetical protein
MSSTPPHSIAEVATAMLLPRNGRDGNTIEKPQVATRMRHFENGAVKKSKMLRYDSGRTPKIDAPVLSPLPRF